MNPWQQYRSADELMIALLMFQFCRHDPRREKTLDRLAKLIGVVGIGVAICVLTFLLWRIIWLLQHGH